MLPIRRLIPAAALAFLSVSTLASTVTYTSSANFLARVLPGAYFENFNGLPDPAAGPVAFSGGAFGYSASAPGDIYLAGGFLGTSLPNQALTVNFTSGNVFAVGGNFFAVDISDVLQSIMVKVTLNDGTVATFTPTSLTDSYRGFVSELAITSLVISGPGTSLYASLDNLTVGTVPEPTSLALLGLAFAGLLASRRRNA